MPVIIGVVVGVTCFILLQTASCCNVSCFLWNLNFATLQGNGNLVTSKKPVTAFQKIHCAGSAEVRFHVSDEFQAVVTIDENLDEYVEIVASHDVLNIGTKNGYSISPTQFVVDVYCPVVTGVSISGSGSFGTEDTIIAPTFDSHVSGSGMIDGTVECDHYSAVITGSGRITVSGKSDDASITVTGSGDFRGNDFNTGNATIAVTGSGNAHIGVTDHIKARISGSGNVYYRGEPQIDSSVSGSGRISKR